MLASVEAKLIAAFGKRENVPRAIAAQAFERGAIVGSDDDAGV